MTKYPEGLPYPQKEGLGFTPVNPILRTELTSGRARQRKRFTSTPTMVSFTWVLNDQQAALFEAWAVQEAALILIQLFAPMMPHLAEECWQVLGQTGLVSETGWPQIERDLLVQDTVTLVVQVNGKKRGEVTVGSNAQDPEIQAAVLALDAVKLALDGKPVRKVIIVPKRIVNVVG